jgi:hypothetical protein
MDNESDRILAQLKKVPYDNQIRTFLEMTAERGKETDRIKAAVAHTSMQQRGIHLLAGKKK